MNNKLIVLRHAGDGRLSSLLAAVGVKLDLRCGGLGTCGRCLVEVHSGRLRGDAGEFTVETPVKLKACRSFLVAGECEVAVPESSLAVQEGVCVTEWTASPLPKRPETVLGIDIGTTTIAVVKARDGQIVGGGGVYNFQSRFGDNVLTRIAHAGTSPQALEELRAAVCASINDVLDELGTEEVVRIAVAGNTVMSCLFHGIDPSSIGVAPFTPPCREFPVKTARELGLRAPGEIPVLTAPAIGGYVGGDLIAGLGEIELGEGELLLDIGTNCEMLLRTADGIVATAAAAGPAFEGAGIEAGCRAVVGAIDRILPGGTFTTLGGGAPKGLCGSAMVDLLAVLHAEEKLNAFGRLVPKAEFYEIAPGIRFYERDVEQILKAKAAVFAGIRALTEACATPLRRIHLAGGFAKHLNLDNAVAIGMLPVCDYTVIGNSSLGGALRLAVEPERLEHLTRLAALPVEIALNQFAQFEDDYIDALLLPEADQ